MVSHLRSFGLFLLLLICAGAIAHAQFSGTITGEIQDPTGSVVPGAKVTLTKTDTGEVKTAVSSASGIYLFVSLSPGSYRLEAVASGFAQSQSTFTLETGQTLNLPVKLSVGTSSRTLMSISSKLSNAARRSPGEATS